jgi:hypothetical protein
MEQDVAPAGGAGAPPGDIMTSREELADGGRRIRRRKRGPAPERRRDGAPRGARVLARERGKLKDWCAARCSIPSLFARGKRKAPRRRGKITAYPAPQRIRAAELWLCTLAPPRDPLY